MPISCHFRDCKALLSMCSSWSSAVLSSTGPLPLPLALLVKNVDVYASITDKCGKVIMFSGCTSVNACVHACVQASVLRNVLKDFDQILYLVMNWFGFVGQMVKVLYTTRYLSELLRQVIALPLSTRERYCDCRCHAVCVSVCRAAYSV